VHVLIQISVHDLGQVSETMVTHTGNATLSREKRTGNR
jgi:hypothetical protein